VGCLPMVKPGAVNNIMLGDPSRPRWDLSGVAGRRGSPHQRRGPLVPYGTRGILLKTCENGK
jgi:hypothetical protein